MYAHYFTSKGKKELLLTATNRPTNPIREFKVSGKVEARKIAKQLKAEPWNF